MNKDDPFVQLLHDDRRYRLDAYRFVSEALAYAQTVMAPSTAAHRGKQRPEAGKNPERHLTGQQLCDAIRQLAIEQFGLMAPMVFRSWGVQNTGDFGEIVYNLIKVGRMKKSGTDRREDFDEVYDFDEAFQKNFRMTAPDHDNDAP